MRVALGFALSASLALSGCFFESNDGPPAYGTLVVDWTVDGSKRSAACRDFSADSIDLIVSTDDGRIVDEFSEYCESFAASIDLSPGTYVVNAVLLDPNGTELTTAVVDRLPIYRHETSVSALDFPADAFY
jgi:hypothetical protein